MKAPSVNQAIVLLFLGAVFATAPARANPLVDFVVNGSGTMETNCLAALTSGCAITASGQAVSAQLNVGSFAVQLFTGSPSSLNGNPAGVGMVGGIQQGLCLPASFLGSLTSATGDTIQFTHAGTVCEEAAPGSALVYKGAFRISGGAGAYGAAAGGGSFASTFTRDGTIVFMHLHGTIQY